MSRSTHVLKLLLISLLVGVNLHASDLLLTFANDPVTANPRPDDLYTSDFTVELRLTRVQVVAGERMFTDREAGLRFDETHLSIYAPLGSIAGWDATGGIGALRVGRGLLGEDVQNQLHRLLAMNEVRLSYIDGDEEFLTFAGAASRVLGEHGGAAFQTHVEAYAAPGFRSWFRGEVAVARPIRSVVISGAIGARLDAVENEWLEPHVAGSGLHGRLGLEWRSLFVRWSFNEYGTNTPHVSIGFRTTFSKTTLTSATPVQVSY